MTTFLERFIKYMQANGVPLNQAQEAIKRALAKHEVQLGIKGGFIGLQRGMFGG